MMPASLKRVAICLLRMACCCFFREVSIRDDDQLWAASGNAKEHLLHDAFLFGQLANYIPMSLTYAL
jgi:hypothetical protein